MWNPLGWVKRYVRRRALLIAVKQFMERPEMAFLKGIFSSKKLGVIIAGILTVLLRELLGLDEATVAQIVQLIMSYIVGQSGVDLALAFKGSKTS